MAAVVPAAPKTLHISLADRDRLVRHAVQALPEECCGVLLGRREDDILHIRAVCPAGNIAEGDRTCTYQIDWRSLFAAVKQGRRGLDALTGFYHSHPDGSTRPSRRDHESAWGEYVYVIVTIDGGTLRDITAWWQPEGGGELREISVTLE